MKLDTDTRPLCPMCQHKLSRVRVGYNEFSYGHYELYCGECHYSKVLKDICEKCGGTGSNNETNPRLRENCLKCKGSGEKE
jgi:DnaJ-class molecular chaperone